MDQVRHTESSLPLQIMRCFITEGHPHLRVQVMLPSLGQAVVEIVEFEDPFEELRIFADFGLMELDACLMALGHKMADALARAMSQFIFEPVIERAQGCFPCHWLGRTRHTSATDLGVGITNTLIEGALLKVFDGEPWGWDFMLHRRAGMIDRLKVGTTNF